MTTLTAAIASAKDDPLDVCECGDFRLDHKGGKGACIFNHPADLTHGYKDCLNFRLALRAQFPHKFQAEKE